MASLLSVLITFLSITCLIHFVLELISLSKRLKVAAKLPGRTAVTPLGIFKLVLKVGFGDRQRKYMKLLSDIAHDEKSLLTKFWLLNNLMIITKDADFIHKVHTMPETYNKPRLFRRTLWYEKTLPLLAGEEHVRHRQILKRAFMLDRLKRLPEVFHEKSIKYVGMMATNVDGEAFDVLDIAGTYGLESFLKANMNMDVDCFGTDLHRAFGGFFRSVSDVSPYGLMAEAQRKFNKSLNSTLNILEEFVSDAMRIFKKSDCGCNIADVLFSPENEFTLEDVQAELIVLIATAIDTSAKSISFSLVMLGMHQEVQNKLIAEIDDISKAEGNRTEITYSFIQKCSYLDIFLKETLRLFAPIPLVARETSRDVEINGLLVPANTIIIMSLFSMQRDEKYWGSDAACFRPERFREKMTNSKAYAPFTYGGRICVGYRYALIATKVFLINFLRSYKVECDYKLEDFKIEMHPMLHLQNGFKVSIKKR